MESYEEYLEIQEKGGRVSSNIFKSISEKIGFMHLVLLVGLVLIINKMAQNVRQNKWAFIAIGVIIIIWILSLRNSSGDKKQIPRHIAEKIATNDMNRLIDINSSYPHGTKAIHTGKFKAQYIDSGDPNGWRLSKYYFGFRIIRPGKSDLNVIYQMNPFPPGDCQGIIERPIEWEGEDIKDFQIVIPERTIVEEKKKD